MIPALPREVVEGWVQVGPQYRSPVVPYSLSVAREETSPGRKMLVTRTMVLSAPVPQEGLFLSNSMCQALMFSCDCR